MEGGGQPEATVESFYHKSGWFELRLCLGQGSVCPLSVFHSCVEAGPATGGLWGWPRRRWAQHSPAVVLLRAKVHLGVGLVPIGTGETTFHHHPTTVTLSVGHFREVL